MMSRGNRRLFLGGALLSPLVLAACGGEETSGAKPPAISYQRDTCDRCGMIISDERYAAGLVAPDGTAELFDDAGEMVLTVREDGLQGRSSWAHDWSGGGWIDGAAAHYVRGDAEMTPMGTGVVAFATAEAAEAYAAEHDGELVTWEALVS